MPIEALGRTYVGQVRLRNEDRLVAADDLGLFMVADGLGGHARGDLAAALAVETVKRHFVDTELVATLSGKNRYNAVARMLAAVKRANAHILTTARADPSARGMATTFAGIHLHAATMVVAHVGDSRVYRLRGGRLERLTRDHTLANELADRGVSPALIPKDDGTSLARALGLEERVDVTIRVEPMMPRDTVLLCTDGLSGVVSDALIGAILAETPSLDEASAELLAVADDAGAPDNVTFVLLRWCA